MEETEITAKAEKASFSEILKKAREESGFTIDDIVAETRISKQVVEQMETRGATGLPEPVFLRGFIKSYAKQVGLDPEEMVRIYKTEYGIEDKPADELKDAMAISASLPEHERPVLPLLLVAGAVILILALAVYGYILKNNTGQDAPGNLTGADVVQTEEGRPVTADTVKSYILEVICIEETTLKISADSGKVTEYKMAPEDHLEIKAKNSFNILINNTCGVTLFLNDKPVEVSGKCGQTANVHLPR